jgi:PIN domain nuclease of toxin-antitoxin system
VLLDTCAIIWLSNNAKLRADALDAIFHAGMHEGVFVSPVSAWEIGLLDRRKPTAGSYFLPYAKTWFRRVMQGPSIKAAPFKADIAIDASCLPEPLHGDPGDRLLIATARHLGFPIVTRDRKIEAYAEQGHVGVIVLRMAREACLNRQA